MSSHSLIETAAVHDPLLRAFRDDVPKYAKGDLQRSNLVQVILALAATVGQQITYTKLIDDDAKRTKLSVHLAERAMIVTLARAASPYASKGSVTFVNSEQEISRIREVSC